MLSFLPMSREHRFEPCKLAHFDPVLDIDLLALCHAKLQQYFPRDDLVAHGSGFNTHAQTFNNALDYAYLVRKLRRPLEAARPDLQMKWNCTALKVIHRAWLAGCCLPNSKTGLFTVAVMVKLQTSRQTNSFPLVLASSHFALCLGHVTPLVPSSLAWLNPLSTRVACVTV